MKSIYDEIRELNLYIINYKKRYNRIDRVAQARLAALYTKLNKRYGN